MYSKVYLSIQAPLIPSEKFPFLNLFFSSFLPLFSFIVKFLFITSFLPTLFFFSLLILLLNSLSFILQKHSLTTIAVQLYSYVPFILTFHTSTTLLFPYSSTLFPVSFTLCYPFSSIDNYKFCLEAFYHQYLFFSIFLPLFFIVLTIFIWLELFPLLSFLFLRSFSMPIKIKNYLY